MYISWEVWQNDKTINMIQINFKTCTFLVPSVYLMLYKTIPYRFARLIEIFKFKKGGVEKHQNIRVAKWQVPLYKYYDILFKNMVHNTI